MALVKFLMNGDALLMVQGVRRNILHDDRTSTDHRPVTDRHALQDHDVRTEPDVVSDPDGGGPHWLIPIAGPILSHTMIEVVDMNVGTE